MPEMWGARAEKYRPRFTSQRLTALAKDGVDDCRVVSLLGIIDAATLGAITTMPSGRVMSKRMIARMGRRMRKTLGPGEQTGGLSRADALLMARRYFRDLPLLSAYDRPWKELLKDLEGGSVFSISGNAMRINGPSRLHRTRVAHEIALFDFAPKRRKILVGDPFHDGSLEWIPANEVKQFASEFMTGGRVFAISVERGAWSAERLVGRVSAGRVARLKSQIERQRVECESLVEGLRDAHAHEVSALMADIEACRSDGEYATGYMDALADLTVAMGKLEPMR